MYIINTFILHKYYKGKINKLVIYLYFTKRELNKFLTPNSRPVGGVSTLTTEPSVDKVLLFELSPVFTDVLCVKYILTPLRIACYQAHC
jgi:hypothetical protein